MSDGMCGLIGPASRLDIVAVAANIFGDDDAISNPDMILAQEGEEGEEGGEVAVGLRASLFPGVWGVQTIGIWRELGKACRRCVLTPLQGFSLYNCCYYLSVIEGSLSLSLFLPPPLFRSLSLVRARARALSLSLTHTHTHTHTHTRLTGVDGN